MLVSVFTVELHTRSVASDELKSGTSPAVVQFPSSADVTDVVEFSPPAGESPCGASDAAGKPAGSTDRRCQPSCDLRLWFPFLL